jgi:hypothetical protein
MIKNSYYRAIMKASCDGILPEMGDYWRNYVKEGFRNYTELHVPSDFIDFIIMCGEMRRNKHD